MYHKRTSFSFVFLTNSNNYLYQPTFSSIHCPWADSSQKKKIKKSSKVPFKENASPVRCPVLGNFFSSLTFCGAASQWTKSARKRSLVFVLSSRPSPLKISLNIDPRQKQLKLEETDNAIIKSILSSLWKNFLLFLPQMVVDQEADKLFSSIFYWRTFLGKSNHGHIWKHYLLNYNFA